MFKVKVTCANIPMLGQTADGMGTWKDCRFFVNDPSMQECDFWFVFDDYGLDVDNIAVCPKENVYFVMGETEAIRIYGEKFVSQFHNIVTVQRDRYRVPKTFYRYLEPWFVGLCFNNGKVDSKHRKPYLELKQMSKKQFKKTKLLSVISSNKQMNKGHKARLKFAEKIKAYFGDQVDFWGRGIRDFEDKWDVLAPYKYHIAIENYVCDDYITEKLYDPFLTMTYPIYYGAANAEEYFGRKGFSRIDIYNPKEAIRIIEQVIQNNTYEEHIEDLWDARNLVLDEYNIFNEMHKLIHQNKCSGPSVKHLLKQDSPSVFERVEGKIRRMLG